MYSLCGAKVIEDFVTGMVLETQDFNMALNAEARATEQTRISLLIYMNYEPKLKESGNGSSTILIDHPLS